MCIPDGNPKDRRKNDDSSEHCHKNPRQKGIEGEHDDRNAHEQKSITDDIDESLAVHVRQSFDVIGNTRGQAA